MEAALLACLRQHDYEPTPAVMKLHGLSRETLNQAHESTRGHLPIEKAFIDGPKAIRALTACGADPNAINDYGIGVLAEAVFQYAGHDVVKALLDAGADPSHLHPDAQRYPPLEAACDRDWSVISALVEGGADPNGTAPIRPIHRAIASRHGLKPLVLMVANGVDLDLPCLCDYRPIELAALINARPEMDFLLGLSVDTHGLRANIHLAASAGLNDAILNCLASDTTVDARDHMGRTPIVNAIASGRCDTVALLLRAGANARQIVRWINKPPPGLTRKVAKDVSDYRGWDREQGWQHGRTLLEMAAMSGNVASLSHLLLHGSTARARHLALRAATSAEDDDCVKLLEAFGADPNWRIARAEIGGD